MVKLVETEEERQAAFDLRKRVFVQEQGIPVEEELDEYDSLPSPEQQLDPSSVLLSTQGEKVLHAVALVGGTAIGTGRVVYPADPHDAHGGHVARIGRMAVEKAWRRQGIGSRILETLEEEARRRGMSQAILHAQTYVKSFYASRGYIEEGEVSLEVEIEHVRMRKRL